MSAFDNKQFASVLAEFGGNVFRRSSVCVELETFLRRIKAGGKRCLEIGTYNGLSAVLLSQFFREVVCVTIENENDPYTKERMRGKIIDHLGIKNIIFHDVQSNEEKEKLIAGLPFDFCYMDGDHTNDTESDFKLVKRCGWVLLHEYWPLQNSVWNLVNSLPPDEVTRAQFDCLAAWKKK